MVFNTFDDVWNALDAGQTVYWYNTSYKITIEPCQKTTNRETERNGKVLRVTCVSNYFGSLLKECELSNLFIEDDYCNTPNCVNC
jgi:hypothetical protein